jgi:RNA polymerase sigma-70 factor (ECF subfamily)
MGSGHLSWRTCNFRQHSIADSKPTSDLEAHLSRAQSKNTTSNGSGAVPSRESDDHALLAECRAGDKQAFNVLILRHQHSVSTLATRLLGNQLEAQDVTQDTFLKAYEGVEEFRGDAKFSTWLYRICHNLCLSSLRKKKNDPITDAGEDTLPEELPDSRGRLPDHVLMRKEWQHLVKRALSHLPQEFREVLVLHHTTPLSYEEMAELLGLPVGTVRSRLHRGREEIKAHLRPYLQDGG